MMKNWMVKIRGGIQAWETPLRAYGWALSMAWHGHGHGSIKKKTW